MTVVHLESLVLRGIRVAGDVAMGLERNGSNRTDGRTPTVFLSFLRHPMTSYPQAGTQPGMRLGSAEDLGAAGAALRAGRPGRSAGVPTCRSLAITAGRTILSRWSPSGSSACAMAWRPATGQVLSGHPGVFQRGRIPPGRQLLPVRHGIGKRAEAALALLRPVARMLQASTRGK
jgi:hypothetical protein